MVCLLVLLCGSLAVLQYRWIGEVSAADLSQRREELENRLNLFSRSLDETIAMNLRQDIQPSAPLMFRRVVREDRGDFREAGSWSA